MFEQMNEKRGISLKESLLLSLTRQAVDTYHMISDGDKIAVGISGGKDSMTMLYALSRLQRFYPAHFELEAITVNTGVPDMNFEVAQEFCETLGVNYTVIATQIYDVVFKERKEENPCSLCSKMRKGTLNEKAIELGCNKIAYAHHKDDLVETFLMSMLYEGRLHTFSPVTKLEKTGLTVIRPLIQITESNVIGFVNRYNIPVIKNLCPEDGISTREDMKNLVRQLNKENQGARDRIYTAITGGNLLDWPERRI